MADRSPPQRRDTSRSLLPLHLQIGHVIGKISGAFHRGVINTVLDDERLEWRSDDERLTDDPMLPRDRISVRAESAADRVISGGAVIPAANVVLARPDDFDGRLDSFRDLHRFLHEVNIGNRT